MINNISRRKLATHAAMRIAAGETQAAINELAAYLIQSGREREADLVVRDIESKLADRGIVVATVTTAHPLTDGLRIAVKDMIGAESLHLKEVVEPAVLGGISIDLPGRRYDATVKSKLASLKELAL